MRGVRLRLVHRSLETPAISALSARIVPATMLSARRWSDGCCPVPRHHQPFSAVTFRDGVYVITFLHVLENVGKVGRHPLGL